MQLPLYREFPDADRSKPLVLLLGNVDHEGITSPLKTSGEQYKKKLLDSTPENWQLILKYFELFSIRAVIVKLNASVYDLLASPKYRYVGEELFSKIAKGRHIAFVFQDLLSDLANPTAFDETVDSEPELDKFDQEDLGLSDHRSNFYLPPQHVRRTVNQLLQNHRLNLVPYKRNAELTVIATTFLREALEQLLFRIYVPAGRLWANEVDRLLQLFRDYLLNTGRKGIRLEQIRTDRGISYEFHGDDSQESTSLSDDFRDFSRFLDLCVSNPKEAEELLKNKDVDVTEIAGILTRYSKEARRLQTDLKHDRERKLLAIRQRLESELMDVLPSSEGWNAINMLVERTIPSATSMGAIYDINQSSPLLPESPVKSGLTINLSPQIIQTVNGIVSHEIRGDFNLSEQDQALLELIRQHGGDRSLELTSVVHELSDQGIPKSSRLSSGQKLKAFVLSASSRLGGVAAGVLQSYIETKLGLK